MKENILKIIAENSNNYRVFGVRSDDRILNVGDALGNSHEWDEENDTYFEDQYLNGICATGFGYLWLDGEQEDQEELEKILNINDQYTGEHQYLIAGDESEYGNDESEVIIRNAVVLAVIN